MAIFAAWMAAVVICGTEIVVTAGYGSGYDAFFVVSSALVLALWTLLLACSVRQMRGLYSRGTLCGIAVCLLAVAFFLLQVRSGLEFNGERLPLDPLRELSEGTQWTDDLYFSQLASSYACYGKVSTLLGGLDEIRYHAAAYCFLGLISRISGVPAFFVFRYTYPVLFLPLYIYMIVSCAAAARRFLGRPGTLSFYDMLAIAAFMVGVLPEAMLKPARIWKYVLPDSVSCGVSVILALLYLRVLLERGCSRRTGGVSGLVFLYVVTPLAIFVCGMTKISTGFLLAGGACWYLFRRNVRSPRYWLAIALYLVAFFLPYYYVMAAPNAPLQGNAPLVITEDGISLQGSRFDIFCFVKDYVAPGCGFFHYAVLGFFAFAVIACTVDFRGRGLRRLFAGAPYLVQELLVVLYLLGVLPGILMRIVGGSAMCFSFAQELPAVIAFVGFGIPERMVGFVRERSRMLLVHGAVAAMLIVMLGNAHVGGLLHGIAFQRIHESSLKTEHFTEDVKSLLKSGHGAAALSAVWHTFWARNRYADSTMYQNICALNHLTAGKKRDYAMYIAEDAELWATYPFDGRFPVRVYPAVTGLVCLDVFYEKGIPGYGLFTYNAGDQLVWGDESDWQGEAFSSKRSLGDVIGSAREQGFRHLIFMHGTGFDVIDL